MAFYRSLPPIRTVAVLAVSLTLAQPGFAQAAGDHTPPAADEQLPKDILVVETSALPTLERLVEEVADAPLVFVGETHDQYSHHLIQLRVIELLSASSPGSLALGLEYFEQHAQPYLDHFIDGAIDERELLRKSGYFERWGYDYALYRPIIQFAREHRIPLIALRPTREAARRAAENGLEGLNAKERQQFPDSIPPSTQRYRDYLKNTFQAHGELEDIERFIRIQEIWDAAMAYRIADYLQQGPDRRMVVLAGTGHLVYQDGIPRRAGKALELEPVVMVPTGTLDPELADYLIAAPTLAPPASPRLGLMVRPDHDGLVISGDPDNIDAVRKGDQLLRLNGEPIRSLADIRLALLDKAPGDSVTITIARELTIGHAFELTIDWTLQ